MNTVYTAFISQWLTYFCRAVGQNTYRELVASEGFEAVDGAERLRVTHPLDRLPAGDEPDVVHLGQRVQEGHEALLVVLSGHPGRVEVQREDRPAERQVTTVQVRKAVRDTDITSSSDKTSLQDGKAMTMDSYPK